MKVFHAFVGVWHEKGNQHKVSSYTYYLVAENEDEAEQMIRKEVESYKYWKHHAHLEEIKSDKKRLRDLTWKGLEDKIVNEALLAQELKKVRSDGGGRKNLLGQLGAMYSYAMAYMQTMEISKKKQEEFTQTHRQLRLLIQKPEVNEAIKSRIKPERMDYLEKGAAFGRPIKQSEKEE